MLLRFITQNRFIRWIGFWRRFYSLRRQGVPVMTLRMAARRQINIIWHLNKGVGDALMFAGVAREYYKKTGERPLLYVPQHYVFRYSDFCWFLMDWRFDLANKKQFENTFELFVTYVQNQRRGKPVKLRNGYTFDLRPVEYIKNIYVIGNTFNNLSGGFPKTGQIVQWVANRMGLVGEIDVKPDIRLTEFEKAFGAFARGKIVVKCGGNGPYKYLNQKIVQGIVDRLKHQYDFIQIGDPKDPVINDAENLFRLNIREFASVLHNARLFVGAIGGMMHLARAVDCPAVILHGCEHDDFYFPSQRKVFADNRCMLCPHRCWWPDKDDERRCPNKYRCINDFNIDRVVGIIREELTQPRELAARPDLFKCVGKMVNINTSDSWWFRFDDFFLDYQIPTPDDECCIGPFLMSCEYDLICPTEYSIPYRVDNYCLSDTSMQAHLLTQEIVSDNPFVMRLVPRPSYFAYILKIATLQEQWVEQWHAEEPIDDTDYWLADSRPKAQYDTFEGYARANHMMNFKLWHTEDIARRRDVDDSVIADAKRKIDAYNQRRNDLMERVDQTYNLIIGPALPGSLKAPINTETIGMIVDRLSILSLKIYHMTEQAQQPNLRKECLEKLAVLNKQRADLLESTKLLIVEYLNGAKAPKEYLQLKMYNDPRLNPMLRK